jgi:hypothetical protein
VSGHLTGPLADPAGIARDIRDRALRLVEDEGRTIFDAARDRWPVRTGRSRDGLTFERAEVGSLIYVRIRNGVDYARFIKSAKIGEAKGPSFRHAMTIELGNPIRAARKGMTQQVKDMVAAALSG